MDGNHIVGLLERIKNRNHKYILILFLGLTIIISLIDLCMYSEKMGDFNIVLIILRIVMCILCIGVICKNKTNHNNFEN